MGTTASTLSRPEVAPSDEIIRLRCHDDSKPLRENVFNLTFHFDAVLDVSKLHDSLSRLVEIGDWKILGARLRLNESGGLEYHIPSRYDANRPGFIFTTTQRPTQTFQSPLTKTDGRPFVLCPSEDLDSLTRDEGRPRRLEDWIYSDRPQLHIHAVTFANATLLTMTWLHTLTDIMGISTFCQAWTAVLRADPDEAIPVPRGTLKHDPLAALSKRVPPEEFINYHNLLKGPGMLHLGLRFLLDQILYPREEERMVCVPGPFLSRLHTQAQQDISSGPEDNPTFISLSDVLFAWWARTIFTALGPRSNQSILLMNILDIRGTLADTDLGTGPYFGNALAQAYTLLPARQLLRDPLGSVALRIRQSLLLHRTVKQIEAQAALDERAWTESGHPAYVGDGGMMFQVCANWNKAHLYDMDFSPAQTTGQTRGAMDASFIHTTRCTQASSWRNIGVVLGQDSAGDWWISWNLRSDLWSKIEGLLKGSFGLQQNGESG